MKEHKVYWRLNWTRESSLHPDTAVASCCARASAFHHSPSHMRVYEHTVSTQRDAICLSNQTVTEPCKHGFTFSCAMCACRDPDCTCRYLTMTSAHFSSLTFISPLHNGEIIFPIRQTAPPHPFCLSLVTHTSKWPPTHNVAGPVRVQGPQLGSTTPVGCS